MLADAGGAASGRRRAGRAVACLARGPGVTRGRLRWSSKKNQTLWAGTRMAAAPARSRRVYGLSGRAAEFMPGLGPLPARAAAVRKWLGGTQLSCRSGFGTQAGTTAIGLENMIIESD